MKTAIVTGATGFIGKAVVQSLNCHNVEVYAVVRNLENARKLLGDFPGIHLVRLDMGKLSLAESLLPKGCDVFYHFAWDGGVFGPAFKDYALQLENAKMACDAVSLAGKLGCRRFVNAGTINEHEAVGYLRTDTGKPRYTCIYSAAKVASDLICMTLAANGNLEYCCGVLSKVFGEGDTSKTIINIVIAKLLRGESPDLIKGVGPYDFIYIHDAAEAFYKIGESGKSGRHYYIGHRKIDAFRCAIERIRDIVAPGTPLNFGVYPDENSIDYNKIDLDLLYGDTGFEAASDFRESILKTVEWVKMLNL